VFFRNGSNAQHPHGANIQKEAQHQNCIIARTEIANNALLLSRKEDTEMRSALCWDITQRIVTVADVSGQPIDTIFKSINPFLTVEDGTGFLDR